MNIAIPPRANGLPAFVWWQDQKTMALVRRQIEGRNATQLTNDEFDEFTIIARDLNLSPLRKQIYVFIFNKTDKLRRNMVVVVGIDGGRSVAARTGNYRPDDREPEWVFKDELKDPLINPHGIEKCTVGIFHRPTRNDPFERIVHTVYWDEFAPILKTADPDDYEWIETGETYEDSGKPKKRKKLRAGAVATLRLDPTKDAWIKAGRNQLAKCAEMGALRKGWPEDLSRVVAEEETHKAMVLEGVDYAEMTPSEMAAKGDTDARMEKIGGPAIMATFDGAGTIERVPYGLFADRVLAETAQWTPDRVKLFREQNREALNEFWAHNKTDALALKAVLEERSTGAKESSPATVMAGTATAAASPEGSSRPTGGAVAPDKPGTLTVGPEAFKLKDQLLAQLASLSAPSDFLSWAKGAQVHLDRLPDQYRTEVETELQRAQEAAGKGR